MVHIDNEAYAGGRVLIIDEEINSVISPVSPHVQEKQIPMEIAVIRLRTISGIVSEGIVYFSDAIWDEVLNPLFGSV